MIGSTTHPDPETNYCNLIWMILPEGKLTKTHTTLDTSWHILGDRLIPEQPL